MYTGAFGIVDFIRLDQWMRDKVGKKRSVDLLTEKDKQVMIQNKDPEYLGKKHRKTSLIHLGVFVIGQAIFWSIGTENIAKMLEYMKDFSWLNEKDFKNSPYPNEMIYRVGNVWGIAFIADFLYSWYYTLFPGK